MAAIDIGPGATSQASSTSLTASRLTYTNPANDTGILTSFELYLATDGSDVKVGTLYGSDNSYTNRDYELIGSVSSGSKQTFTGKSCSVSSGDILGVYGSTGTIYYATVGSCYSFLSGDCCDLGTHTFSTSTRDESVYATGTTEVGGWTTAKLGSIASSSIQKVAGISVASVKKVAGVAVQ